MTARAKTVSAPTTLEPVPLAPKAANADRLHGGPRLTHAGRYQLIDSISGDVHGRLYEAWDPLLDRGVTVKTLQFGLKMSARIAVDRQILRASRAAATLHHRSIASVLDCGLSAHGVYIVTEHLSGQDLESALYEGWRPGTAEAIKLARRIAAALAYAHERGVVHGGLEPACIVLSNLGRPKILNFGLVDALRETDVAELADVTLGCLAYRAPEQWVGGLAEPRSDLFALGVVLYELLTGRRAFIEDTADTLLQSALNGPAVPLASLRPDLPAELTHLIESAMAFEPDQRPASAAAMSAQLRSLGKRMSAPAQEVPVKAPPPVRGTRSTGWVQARDWLGRLLGLGSARPLARPVPRRRSVAPASRWPQTEAVTMRAATTETQSA